MPTAWCCARFSTPCRRHEPRSDGHTADTLHQRILREIEERILSGALRPGDRIPSEHELADQYGCSRMTINKAITQLAKAGLPRAPAPRWHLRAAAAGDLGGAGGAHRGERGGGTGPAVSLRAHRLSQRQATREECDRLELASGAEVLAITCLHRAGDRPFCLEERLINPAAIGDSPALDVERVSPGAWLLEHVPWRVAEHAIVATFGYRCGLGDAEDRSRERPASGSSGAHGTPSRSSPPCGSPTPPTATASSLASRRRTAVA